MIRASLIIYLDPIISILLSSSLFLFCSSHPHHISVTARSEMLSELLSLVGLIAHMIRPAMTLFTMLGRDAGLSDPQLGETSNANHITLTFRTALIADLVTGLRYGVRYCLVTVSQGNRSFCFAVGLLSSGISPLSDCLYRAGRQRL